MSQLKYDRDAAAADLLNRISNATGIESFNSSSKLKLIADIIAQEIAFFAESANAMFDAMYLETSEGRDLDINAAKYGIYRKINSSVVLNASDSIIMIELEDGSQFGSVINSPIQLYAGSIIAEYADFSITLLDDVTLSPIDTSVPLSVKIVSEYENSGFSINENDVLRINGRDIDISALINKFIIRITKPISIDGSIEDDESLRLRAKLARDARNRSTVEAVAGIIGTIPTIHGYAVLENQRGTGSIDIYFVTRQMQETGLMSDVESTKALIRSRLPEVLPFGKDLKIITPDRIAVKIYYSAEDDNRFSRSIEDIILETFKNTYSFNSSNELIVKDFTDAVVDVIDDINFRIDRVELIDELLGVPIKSGTISISAPLSFYMSLSRENIVRN